MNFKSSLIFFYIIILGFTTLPRVAIAAQKAKIVSSEVEIYADADFDSEVLTSVREGEIYFISDKTYGPFYRIKLKNGKVGYIVDYELDIEGKGRLQEKDLDVLMFERMSRDNKKMDDHLDEQTEEAQLFGKPYMGPMIQFINYHENTMGGDQVDDLWALGYKKISDFSWSVIGSFGAPKYYADKTGGRTTGLNLWGDIGVSSQVVNFKNSGIRFGGSLFTHISLIQLETSQRKFDLHDLTLGLALETGWLYQITSKYVFELYLKYYFDKTNYAGLGCSFLF